jgi:hypothetical protein
MPFYSSKSTRIVPVCKGTGHDSNLHKQFMLAKKEYKIMCMPLHIVLYIITLGCFCNCCCQKTANELLCEDDTDTCCSR